MAHGYRILQQWNNWLTQQFLGNCLLEAEQQLLSSLLSRHFGKHALLLGVPNQIDLLKATPIPCHTILSPITFKEKKFDYGYIDGDFHELPLLTGDIDLVLLPHILELIDNPRQLLAEACRVIKPEGLIAICGFNPNSIWGLRKILSKQKIIPWSVNFIQPHKVKNWLELADFEMENRASTLYRPPISQPKIHQKLHFLEQVGKTCFPLFGGVYILLARAKVVPLTPIKLKWKQQLSNIRISSSVTGQIAQQSK